MAAPHVTGLVALLLSQDAGRKPTMIRTLLELYATNDEHDTNRGWGVIDALAAYTNEGSLDDKYGGLRVIVEHDGAPVVDAEVLIRRGDTVITNRTNGEGIAYFHYLECLEEGTYEVTATKVTGTGTLSGICVGVNTSRGVKASEAPPIEITLSL